MRVMVGDDSGETLTMVKCPHCVDGIDPEPLIRTSTICCGGTECGGKKCTGPEEIQDAESQECTMCGGNKFVDAQEALAYCLEV